MTTEDTKFKTGGKGKWILIAVVLIGVGVYFGWRQYFDGRESTDNAQVDGHIHPVAARIFGQITAINVQDNAFVKEGTPLIEIDPSDYKVALNKAKAELEAAVAAAEAAGIHVPLTSVTASSQVSLADAGIETAQAARDTAVKDAEAANARLELIEAQSRQALAVRVKADQDLERMRLLVAKDEVSRQQYDSAVSAADAARAAYEAAEAGIAEVSRSIEAARGRVQQAEARIKEALANQSASRTAPEQMAISRANRQAAEARVKLAEAALEQAELNLSYTRIKAPIDGFISQRKVETGQMAQAGQPLLSMVPLHNIWITANYKENQLENMQPGNKAIIAVDAYGGRKFNGHVDSIAAATGARFSLLPPENATGNYVKVVQRIPVKIVIDDAIDTEYPLRPGLSVIATVYTDLVASD
ncbi:MAG: HlyD family secretion protein [Acidobacteriota bacterium]|jgi:membrane fusion protein (multidrug efflux system)|nr:HlyD family secretion protein [Acidobacteriota bacterium]